MSRCPRTDAVLEAAFGPGISSGQAEHAAGCSECARALAAARRFENELRSTGIELSPEPMPLPEEVLMVSDGSEPRFRSARSRFAAGGAALGVLVGAFFFGGQWLGETFWSAFQAPSGTVGSVGDAAALIGAPPDGVLITEDGVVGIRDLGGSFELVLVRSTGGGLEEFVLDTVPEREISVISCADDELAQGDFVWGSKPGVIDVEGEGDAVVRDDELMLFAFDPGTNARTVTLIERNGRSTIDHGRWHVQDCLVADAAEMPRRIAAEAEAAARQAEAAARQAEAAARQAQQALPPLSEAVVCADWRDLDEAAQLALTKDVIFEWLMPAVRAREELPDASVDEVVRAARSSLDKGCQDPANARKVLADIAVDVYGR